MTKLLVGKIGAARNWQSAKTETCCPGPKPPGLSYIFPDQKRKEWEDDRHADCVQHGPVAKKFEGLMKAGKLGGGVFQTEDCKKTYEELKIKGVKFKGPPEKKPYGVPAGDGCFSRLTTEISRVDRLLKHVPLSI